MHPPAHARRVPTLFRMWIARSLSPSLGCMTGVIPAYGFLDSRKIASVLLPPHASAHTCRHSSGAICSTMPPCGNDHVALKSEFL